MKTIFVSSTFRDMHYERDAIQQIVQPRINAVANRYGQSVSFCDLRWGINTEELESDVGNQKVLEVCLDEIDRCQPPMVVILGDRYGWIPKEDLISSLTERKHLQLEDLRKSVTALEIEYGALASAERLNNTLFYFREMTPPVPEGYVETDEEHIGLLHELKQRIYTLTGGRVKTYRVSWDGTAFAGIDGFADLLASDLEAMLLPEWERSSSMTPLQREQYTHRTFVEEKANMFRARKPLAQKHLEFLRKDHALILRGLPGLGKSTLLSYLVTQLEEERTVIPVICGLTPSTNTAAGVLKYIVRSLESILELPHFQQEDEAADIKHWRDRLDELCGECAERHFPVTIALDAIDQLFPDDNLRKLVFIPAQTSETVQLLMTCLPDVNLNGRHSLKLEPVSDEEKHLILTGIMESQRRELSEAVIKAITAKPSSDNPLYLSLLTRRLMMMNKTDFDTINAHGGSMNAITAYQQQLVAQCPDDLEEMSATLLQIAAQRINGTLVERCSTLLAHSRHGLRQSDLAALLPGMFNQLDFSHFISYLSDCFLLRDDGRYDFSHKSFRNALLKRADHTKALHKQLYNHFSSLDPNDPVATQETGYHCILAGDPDAFCAYVDTLYSRKDASGKRHTAQALYQTTMADNGKWLFALLQNAPATQTTRSLLNLLTEHYYSLSTDTFDESRILPRIREQARILAKAVHQALNSPGSARTAAAIYEDFARELFATKEKRSLRLTVRQEAVALLEAIAERDRQTQECLAAAYRNLGIAYQKADEDYTYPTAAEYYTKALEAYKTLEAESTLPRLLRQIALCYDDLAELYSNPLVTAFTPEEDQLPYTSKTPLLIQRRKKAMEYAENAITIRQRLNKEDPTQNNRLALSYSYDTLATLHANQPSPDSRNQAIRLRTLQKELLEGLAEESRSVTMRKRLATCLLDLGNLHATSFKKADYVTAFHCFQAAGNLLIQRMNALRTTESGVDYFACRLRMARMLYQVGNKQNWQTALRVSQQAHEFLSNRKSQDEQNQKRLLLLLDDLITASQVALGEIPYTEPAKDEKEGDYNNYYSYAELLEILSLMEQEDVAKIPVHILSMFHQYDLKVYKKHLSPTIPLEEQEIQEDTTTMLGVMALEYWCDSAQAQDELVALYEENERKFQEENQK